MRGGQVGRVLAIVAVWLISVVVFPAGASGQGGQASGDAESVLAVVDAGQGTFDPKSGRLVLLRVEPRAVWFTDRPYRKTGVYRIPKLTTVFFDNQVPPNAALEFQGNDKNHDVALVELSDPKYNAAKRRLAFSANVLKDPTTDLQSHGALEKYARRHDGKIAKTFGATTLFLDNAPPQEICPNVGDASPTKTFPDDNTVRLCFYGIVGGSSTATTALDCTTTGATYVERSTGSGPNILDAPRVDFQREEEDLIIDAGGNRATATEDWNHVGSKLATAIEVDVHAGVGGRQGYWLSLYCTLRAEDAWVVVG